MEDGKNYQVTLFMEKFAFQALYLSTTTNLSSSSKFFTNQAPEEYKTNAGTALIAIFTAWDEKSLCVAARLRSLRSDDPLSKGHPRPIKQGLEL